MFAATTSARDPLAPGARSRWRRSARPQSRAATRAHEPAPELGPDPLGDLLAHPELAGVLPLDDCEPCSMPTRQRPADATALRDRHVLPRPVGEQRPPHAGARILAGPPLRKVCRSAVDAGSERGSGTA